MADSTYENDFEWLTKEIADEYYRRAQKLPDNGMQDVGQRYELRRELQKRCNLTELEAINILNGRNVADYVQNSLIRQGIVKVEISDKDKAEKQRLLDTIADLESKIKNEKLVDEDMD